jgi:hypothetical protein
VHAFYVWEAYSVVIVGIWLLRAIIRNQCNMATHPMDESVGKRHHIVFSFYSWFFYEIEMKNRVQ